LVASDAGIVDEDVDFAELSDGGLEGGLDLLFVADVESKCGCRSARVGDFANSLSFS
jgi:hypothetical protein